MGLTLPSSGKSPSPGVYRKVHLLATRALLTTPMPAPVATPLRRLRPVLEAVIRADRHRWLAAISHPDVLHRLLPAMAGMDRWENALDAAIPTLLLQLGSLPEAVIWDRPSDGVLDGQRRAAARVDGLLANQSGVLLRVNGSDVPFETLRPAHYVHTLRHGVELATTDGFPLASLEAHPEKSGSTLSLGDHPVQRWVEALNGALDLLAERFNRWTSELPGTLRRAVPVGFEPERHFSASYREAPHQIYLTLHPDTLTLAEALIHEGQHGKLNALTWLDPVLENGWTDWTESPVRPDLRPLMGLLLAVHAFVPVALFHRALLDTPLAQTARFRQRRIEVLAGNARGLALLAERARPTALGRRMLDELHALHTRAMEGVDLALPISLPPG